MYLFYSDIYSHCIPWSVWKRKPPSMGGVCSVFKIKLRSKKRSRKKRKKRKKTLLKSIKPPTPPPAQANKNSRDNSGIFYLICCSLLFSEVQWYHHFQSPWVIPILILRCCQPFYRMHIIYKVLLHFCGHICILNVLYFLDDNITWNMIAYFWVVIISTSSKLKNLWFLFQFSSNETYKEILYNLLMLKKYWKSLVTDV